MNTALRETWETRQLLRQFYLYYALQQSTKNLRINWNILEELQRAQSPYLLVCRWSQVLFLSFELRRYRSHILLSQQSTLGNADFILQKLAYRIKQRNMEWEDSTLQDDWEKLIRERKNVWFPLESIAASGNDSLLFLVKMAKAQHIPIVPIEFSTSSSHFPRHFSPFRFPNLFSRTVVFVGNPLQMENIPVQTACSEVEQAFHHLEKLTQNLLQTLPDTSTR